MQLTELLEALPPHLVAERLPGREDPVVRGIRYDSRRVTPGDLFVALKGALSDGHVFLEQAVELGAVALLVEELPESPPAQVAIARVSDTRRALAPLAVRFFGAPSEALLLVGVTGTNGKTSTTILLESILRAAGFRVGLIGTIEVRYADERVRAVNTTPESLDLQRMLRDMCTKNVSAVSMEVSSHGLALGRVDGCRFAAVAMTNVTQDHLDFHESMEDYVGAKALLFSRHLRPGGAAVINVDDPNAAIFEAAATDAEARIFRVSRQREDADVRLIDAETSLSGTRARVALGTLELDFELPLLGDFNIENALVATAIAWSLDVPEDAIVRGIAECPQVPGRVERVATLDPRAPTVLVDYAHTPDAVDKLLQSVRPIAAGRLVTVFGCGGDRDRTKRPHMARAVAAWSDLAIATSDNPRTEDPERILDDVEPGLEELRKVEPERLGASSRAFARVPDRRAAIRLAIELAADDDTVVLAGKGHEDYQIVGREVLPFDDREEARRALAARFAGAEGAGDAG